MKIYFYPCTLDYFLSDNSDKFSNMQAKNLIFYKKARHFPSLRGQEKGGFLKLLIQALHVGASLRDAGRRALNSSTGCNSRREFKPIVLGLLSLFFVPFVVKGGDFTCFLKNPSSLKNKLRGPLHKTAPL